MRSDIQPLEAEVGSSRWVVRGVVEAEFMGGNLSCQILR
jgi:hypothetical protein